MLSVLCDKFRSIVSCVCDLQESQLSQMLSQVLYECVSHEKLEILSTLTSLHQVRPLIDYSILCVDQILLLWILSSLSWSTNTRETYAVKIFLKKLHTCAFFVFMLLINFTFTFAMLHNFHILKLQNTYLNKHLKTVIWVTM